MYKVAIADKNGTVKHLFKVHEHGFNEQDTLNNVIDLETNREPIKANPGDSISLMEYTIEEQIKDFNKQKVLYNDQWYETKIYTVNLGDVYGQPNRADKRFSHFAILLGELRRVHAMGGDWEVF